MGFGLVTISVILISNSLDLYNIFVYENVYLKPTPYGYVPILENPSDYSSVVINVKGGSFLYVEDWTRAVNGKVVFAKIRTGLNEGFINQEMLVRTSINPYPIISFLMFSFIFSFSLFRVFKYFRG